MKTTLFYIFACLLSGSCNIPITGTETRSITQEISNDSSKIISKQPTTPTQEELTNAYCKAIAEYIKVIYKKGKPLPDTLFIGRHPDFPGITLPATIQKANIMLLTSDEAKQKLQYRKSLVLLNVMGWVDSSNPAFVIVTFFEFKPQHNCSVSLKRDAKSNEWELDSLHFDYPYGRQTKNH